MQAFGFPGGISAQAFFTVRNTMRGSLELSGPDVNAMACELAEFAANVAGAPMTDVGRAVRDTLMEKHDAWLEAYENDND